MADHPRRSFGGDELTQSFIDVAIRLALLAVLIYAAFVLISPFITIAVWSVILAVALYPLYDWVALRLGGRPRLASVLVTVLTLAVVIGPGVWLALGLIDSFVIVSDKLQGGAWSVPGPPDFIKAWPVVGETLYEFWELASTNLMDLFVKAAPYLRPVGLTLLKFTGNAGWFVVEFLVAIVAAGFLFVPGPQLAAALKRFARRIAFERGEEFVVLAGLTIRSVSRGVLGISALQAVLAGVGLILFGIPGAAPIASAALIAGIVQIGAGVVLVPVVIWAWTILSTPAAIAFTIYCVVVGFADNVLKPLVMTRGLSTPLFVILIGLIGGTLAYGIEGLFLGPIILAVLWELVWVWARAEAEASS